MTQETKDRLLFEADCLITRVAVWRDVAVVVLGWQHHELSGFDRSIETFQRLRQEIERSDVTG